MKRFESFKKSLDSLAEAKERDMSDSFVLSGTSAKFSITFDLAWKVMKDIMVQHYEIIDFVAGSPKEVLKKAFCDRIINVYINEMYLLKDTIEKLGLTGEYYGEDQSI